jgi:N-acetylmuramoyl-L-alanine amidase-like protein/zinc carboxypeptidase
VETIGHSARGRPIRALRLGPADAPTKVLVVGVIHGTEPAGRAVIRWLRAEAPPSQVQLWLVDTVNPDGLAAGTRQNARGVDLNRNFPWHWRPIGTRFSTYYSGPLPLSEPESRAVAAFAKRIRPDVSIWYHQHLRLVTADRGHARLERLYAQRSGLPRRRIGPYTGTAIGWLNQRFPGTTSFVVELPAGALTGAAAERHARAVRAVARAARASRASSAAARPRIVQKPIPFGAKRRAEMRRYARRHYGIDDYRLKNPRVIVEHYTASNNFGSAYNTFARDVPDVELNELPGVCAHYIVDKDGTIYQLVRTKWMCRHTVGLNYTAIGIEHVGQSDGQVMGNSRQLRSSLRLTRFLEGRYGIKTRNVIGHNESLSSPYHKERVARLRNQTHGDMRRSTMQRYRKLLSRLPRP